MTDRPRNLGQCVPVPMHAIHTKHPVLGRLGQCGSDKVGSIEEYAQSRGQVQSFEDNLHTISPCCNSQLLWCATGEFKKKDKLAKPKPSHKGTVIYRLKPFKNQVQDYIPSSWCRRMCQSRRSGRGSHQ